MPLRLLAGLTVPRRLRQAEPLAGPPALAPQDRVKEVEEEEREAAALAASQPAPLLLSTSPGSYMGTSPVPSSPLSRSMSKPPSWAEDLVQTVGC